MRPTHTLSRPLSASLLARRCNLLLVKYSVFTVWMPQKHKARTLGVLGLSTVLATGGGGTPPTWRERERGLTRVRGGGGGRRERERESVCSTTTASVHCTGALVPSFCFRSAVCVAAAWASVESRETGFFSIQTDATRSPCWQKTELPLSRDTVLSVSGYPRRLLRPTSVEVLSFQSLQASA